MEDLFEMDNTPEWLYEAAELCARMQREDGDDADRMALARALEEATGLTAGELAAKLASGATLCARVAADDGSAGLARALAEREAALREDEPEMDLAAELRKSPALCALLLKGEDLDAALDYVQPARVRRRAERDILDRIRKRNLRPLAMGAGAAAPEPVGLTERQLRDIDARLKRGERVHLGY